MIRLLTILSLLTVSSIINSGCTQMSGFVMNDSGQGYYKKGNYAMARKEFQRAALDNPKNANYQYNLAQAMRKQGDMFAAEQTYRRAIEIDPTHQPAYHGLAELMVTQSREKDAVALMETWAGSQPYTAESNIELAWIKSKLGDTASAESSLQQAIKANPRNGVAVAQLGELYERKGQYQSAAALYQRSLQMNPLQNEVRSRLTTIKDAHPEVYNNGTMMAYDSNGIPMTATQGAYPATQMAAYDPLGANTLGTNAYIPQQGVVVTPSYTNPYAPQLATTSPIYPQQMGYVPTVPQQHTVYYPDMTSQYALSPAITPAPVTLGQATSSIPMIAGGDPAHADGDPVPVMNPF